MVAHGRGIGTNLIAMIIYGVASSRARRPLWVAEQVGADYEFHKIDFGAGEHRSAEYLKINPNARVPALVDGSMTVDVTVEAAVDLAMARDCLTSSAKLRDICRMTTQPSG